MKYGIEYKMNKLKLEIRYIIQVQTRIYWVGTDED